MGYYAYMSDEVETFSMPLAGRQILFKRASLGQVIVLRRNAERMIKLAESEEGQGVAVVQSVVKTLDFIETLIVSEQDRQFIEDEMLAGNIDWQDLVKVIGGAPDERADDEPVKPVRRAPKKSPKAAPVAVPEVAAVRTPAKKVTPRGRPKR